MIEELSTIFIYFSTGFCIPILSRFLMKFYPCSIHSYVGDIIKFYCGRQNRKTSRKYSYLKHKHNRLSLLKKQYLYNKILWGALYLCLCITLKYVIKGYISENYPLYLLFIFIFLLGFSANIDARFNIIPDIITFPMLMVGVSISAYSQNIGLNTTLNISSLNSIFSSIAAYILCFSIALMFYFKKPYAFGGGDVKLIAAIASFTGIEELGKLLIIAFATMFAHCALKKKKSAPLAPFIFVSFIIWIYYKIIAAT